jgi:hypothetical protein
MSQRAQNLSPCKFLFRRSPRKSINIPGGERCLIIMEKSCEPKEKRAVTPSMHEPEVTVYSEVKDNEASHDTSRCASMRSEAGEPEVSCREDPYSGFDEPLY